MIHRCIVWASVLIFLAGCGGATKTRGQKASKDYDHPQDLVFSAVQTILRERGYEIVNADADSGVIDTSWVEQKGHRTQAQARVTPLGHRWSRVQMEILYDKKGFAGGDWKPEPVKVSVYDDLFNDIDTQIYREYFLKIERPAPAEAPAKD